MFSLVSSRQETCSPVSSMTTSSMTTSSMTTSSMTTTSCTNLQHNNTHFNIIFMNCQPKPEPSQRNFHILPSQSFFKAEDKMAPVNPHLTTWLTLRKTTHHAASDHQQQ